MSRLITVNVTAVDSTELVATTAIEIGSPFVEQVETIGGKNIISMTGYSGDHLYEVTETVAAVQALLNAANTSDDTIRNISVTVLREEGYEESNYTSRTISLQVAHIFRVDEDPDDSDKSIITYRPNRHTVSSDKRYYVDESRADIKTAANA